MKKVILSCLLFICAKQVFSQDTSLLSTNQKRNKINKNGMLVLGSWAASNIITGAIFSANSSRQTKYFHQMNVYWNVVNISLSGFGFYKALKAKTNQSLTTSFKEQTKLEKTFLLNTGLDLAYIAGGLYLHEKGKTPAKNSLKLKGYGSSVILQGSFLLLFDATMYAMHHNNGKPLYKLMQKVDIDASPLGISLRLGL